MTARDYAHIMVSLTCYIGMYRVVPPLILSGSNLSVSATQNGAQVAIHILNRSRDNLLSYKETIEGLR